MKVLELFAGSRSIGKAAEELGYQVFSTDIEPFESIDYVVDFMDFDLRKLPWVPDIIWASPPCTSYSIAAVSHHREGQYPMSELAVKSDQMVLQLLRLIKFLKPKYWFIENPRGMLRKMHFMEDLNRSTVTYCQYGDNRMKPTDIWHESTWVPRAMCKNGDSCHQSAPRGSRTGTQGRANDYERSKIPHELCLEVLRSCKTT